MCMVHLLIGDFDWNTNTWITIIPWMSEPRMISPQSNHQDWFQRKQQLKKTDQWSGAVIRYYVDYAFSWSFLEKRSNKRWEIVLLLTFICFSSTLSKRPTWRRKDSYDWIIACFERMESSNQGDSSKDLKVIFVLNSKNANACAWKKQKKKKRFFFVPWRS